MEIIPVLGFKGKILLGKQCLMRLMVSQNESEHCKVSFVLNFFSPLSEICSVVKQHFICVFHN